MQVCRLDPLDRPNLQKAEHVAPDSVPHQTLLLSGFHLVLPVEGKGPHVLVFCRRAHLLSFTEEVDNNWEGLLLAHFTVR